MTTKVWRTKRLKHIKKRTKFSCTGNTGAGVYIYNMHFDGSFTSSFEKSGKIQVAI